ncbi:hypothetical protein [Halopseudomonas pelagia]|uniref:hypothetical protein n=1 Tax=Halopseudomonas pelagia TaxID=553151 RepID=UPI0003A1CD28|nr:hypothetical protein [Halopseudomonas pelagia]
MFTEAQFNRSTLECMTALRRRLKQELGVIVRLSDVDAVEHMIRLSRDSRLGDIRELGLRLADMTTPTAEPELATPLGQGAIASRQRLLHQAPSTDFDPPPPSRQDESAPVRIYRGQIVR